MKIIKKKVVSHKIYGEITDERKAIIDKWVEQMGGYREIFNHNLVSPAGLYQWYSVGAIPPTFWRKIARISPEKNKIIIKLLPELFKAWCAALDFKDSK